MTPHLSGFVDRAEYKDFTPLELSTLWSIVRDTEWDVDSMDEFVCLLEVDGGARLIHSLPSAMISELAALPPDRLAPVTTAGAATEEMDCNPEDIRPIVDDMVRLSRLALDSGRGVYLWNSL
ncbi:MAG: hypothetical protein K1X67_04540 [Fimbriimonadaceae bacterium]|nr:hypothetical protein [Fimbriimonadaceae bacterium]